MNRKISTQDLIQWLIYAMVILVPIVYCTAFDSALAITKLTVLRGLTLLIVAIWGIQILAQGKIRIRKSPLNKWLLAYGGVTALTTFFSTYFWVSFFGSNVHFIGFMTVLNLLFLVGVMATFFQEKQDLQRYIKISVWTAVGLSLYGLLKREGVETGESTHLGTYLTFHWMLLVGLWVNGRSLLEKVGYGLAGIIMVTFLVPYFAHWSSELQPDRVNWEVSAIAMTRDHPMLGHGLATFRDVYNEYRRTGDLQDNFSPEMPHMGYLNIAATQGLLGLSIYMGMIGVWFLLLVKVLRDPEAPTPRKITAWSFLAAGGVYLIQNFMSFGVIETLLPFYLLMGASASLYHMTTDTRLQSKQFYSIKLVRRKKLVFILLVVTLSSFSGWFTLRQASADYHLEQGDRARKEGKVELMLEQYELATQLMPWMYEYWQRYGEGAFYVGTMGNNDIGRAETLIKNSIEAYGQAKVRMQTMPTIQRNLALAYVAYADILTARGQTTKAIEARNQGADWYREAVEVAVNNPLYSYNYGKLLHSMDRIEEAKNAFRYVVELRGTYQDTNYQLALIETEQKNYDKARTYIQAAFRDNTGIEKVKLLQQRIYGETEDEAAL